MNNDNYFAIMLEQLAEVVINAFKTYMSQMSDLFTSGILDLNTPKGKQ